MFFYIQMNEISSQFPKEHPKIPNWQESVRIFLHKLK